MTGKKQNPPPKHGEEPGQIDAVISGLCAREEVLERSLEDRIMSQAPDKLMEAEHPSRNSQRKNVTGGARGKDEEGTKALFS